MAPSRPPHRALPAQFSLGVLAGVSGYSWSNPPESQAHTRRGNMNSLSHLPVGPGPPHRLHPGSSGMVGPSDSPSPIWTLRVYLGMLTLPIGTAVAATAGCHRDVGWRGGWSTAGDRLRTCEIHPWVCLCEHWVTVSKATWEPHLSAWARPLVTLPLDWMRLQTNKPKNMSKC